MSQTRGLVLPRMSLWLNDDLPWLVGITDDWPRSCNLATLQGEERTSKEVLKSGKVATLRNQTVQMSGKSENAQGLMSPLSVAKERPDQLRITWGLRVLSLRPFKPWSHLSVIPCCRAWKFWRSRRDLHLYHSSKMISSQEVLKAQGQILCLWDLSVVELPMLLIHMRHIPILKH